MSSWAMVALFSSKCDTRSSILHFSCCSVASRATSLEFSTVKSGAICSLSARLRVLSDPGEFCRQITSNVKNNSSPNNKSTFLFSFVQARQKPIPDKEKYPSYPFHFNTEEFIQAQNPNIHLDDESTVLFDAYLRLLWSYS